MVHTANTETKALVMADLLLRDQAETPIMHRRLAPAGRVS